MKLAFETTRQFQKDLTSFSTLDQKRIADNINRYARIVAEGGNALAHIAPQALRGSQEESSLYVLKVGTTIRVILAIDEDPLFERTLVTLFRVVRKDRLSRSLDSVMESVLQQLGAGR